MRMIKRTLLLAFTVLSVSFFAQGQSFFQLQEEASSASVPGWNIKTNLLYDATATINLGAEFRTGERTSFDIPVSYNPWTFGANRKWKHAGAQPELRWWPRGR